MAYLFAWLEEKGYRREMVRGTPDSIGLTRNHVRRVLGWPRTKEGALEDPPDRRTPLTREDLMRRVLFLRGWPAHKIEPAIRATLAREREAARPVTPSTEATPCVHPAVLTPQRSQTVPP